MVKSISCFGLRMSESSYYQEYARSVIEDFSNRGEDAKNLLVDSVNELPAARVLDIGCGPGQEMLSFAQKKNSFCVGIDIGDELGKIGPPFAEQFGCSRRVKFVQGIGEELPFRSESFDVVLCRVALPYMDNKKTIAEVSRVLNPGGVFLLKTHAAPFYFGMLGNGLLALSPKKTAYPLICLFIGMWHLLTGKQLRNGFWSGKEVFQTEGFLKKEFSKHGLKIEFELKDTNRQTPSYFVVKSSK
ncbi:MAG: class I SAM-dependent methyltransferase [Acidobacteria bacterium]|nr:class I SAM-dependent methyltransferase [Acidobacteriota bacterium]